MFDRLLLGATAGGAAAPDNPDLDLSLMRYEGLKNYHDTKYLDSGDPKSFFWKPDGTKLYTLGSSKLLEWTLSSAWNFASISNSHAIVKSNYYDIHFKDDGFKFWLLGLNGLVEEYSLSIAWDLTSTITLLNSATLNLNGFDVFLSFVFSSNGDKLFASSSSAYGAFEWDLNTPWDINTLQFNGTKDLARFHTEIKSYIPSAGYATAGCTFKPVGLEFYFCDESSDRIYQKTLTTAWDISSFQAGLKYVSAGCGNPGAVTWKPDGTRVYITDFSDDRIYQKDVTTAWDISTATTGNNGFLSTISQNSAVRGLAFDSTGYKLFICGSGNQVVNEYSLSTAWDVTSATVTANTLTIGFTGYGVFFRSNGMELYVNGVASVKCFYLNTAWDITSVNSNYTYNYGAQIYHRRFADSCALKQDGSGFVGVTDSGVLVDHSFSTSWDLSSASWTPLSDKYLHIQPITTGIYLEGAPGCFTINSTGTKAYSTVQPSGSNMDRIHEFDLTTSWDLPSGTLAGSAVYPEPNSYAPLKDGTSNDYPLQKIKWTDNNSKMHGLHVDGNLYEFSASVPSSVSSAYAGHDLQNADGFIAHAPTPTDIEFSPDGTKLYAIDTTYSRVYYYDLSVAWDPSTRIGSYTSRSGTLSSPYGLCFKPDGSTYYILRTTEVRQYTPSVNWNVASNTLDYTLNLTSLFGFTANALGMAFNDDGSKFFVLSSSSVYGINLSTNWDLSTASYTGEAFSTGLGSGSSAAIGLVFSESGKTFLTQKSLNYHYTLYRYELSTAWDVSTAALDAEYPQLLLAGAGSHAFTAGKNGRYLYTMGDPAIITRFDLT